MRWRVKDVIQAVETLAPPELAEAWDNVGLQAGSRNWPVERVWVALDPLPHVVEAACRANIDLLITHHPLIFKPLASVDCGTGTGMIIEAALGNHMAIFAAHTNLDAVAHGVNDVLAQRIGLRNVGVFMPAKDCSRAENGSGDRRQGRASVQGLGRTGDLPVKMTLATLAGEAKACIGAKAVTIAGDPELGVEKVALCSGSGSSLLGQFLASDAQAYISGDLRYHDAREVEMAGKGLIDIGHFASEHLIVEVLADRLRQVLTAAGAGIRVEACGLEKDPFTTI